MDQGREGGPGKIGISNIADWTGKNMTEAGHAMIDNNHANKVKL